ncbi:hypothetical protein [Streptomyces sp. C10-9-1]
MSEGPNRSTRTPRVAAQPGGVHENEILGEWREADVFTTPPDA